MKIATTHLELAATHVATRRHEARESLRTWAGEPPNPASAPRESVQFSPAALAAEASAATGPEGVADDEGHSAGDPRLTLIRTLIEMLTGRPVTVFDAAELAPDSPAVDLAVPPSAGQPAAGFSLEYDRHESLDESERTEFSASGTVQTADGKSIAFSVDLVMARAFHAESDVSLRLGEAARRKDPLVVNFGGNAASLTDTRFAFDLDGDGTTEAIPFVTAGSGFLFLDRNGDGRATDGGELFGTKSGDGFADLAAFDDDGNGWIDEGDAVFSRLQVWSRDGAGADRYRSMQDAGVGAIGLARVATPFELRDARNASLGAVRSSGILLRESGDAGTIQQIDLTA